MQFEINYGSCPRVAGQPYQPPHQAWIAQCDQTGIRYVTPPPNFEQIHVCYENAASNVWPESPKDTTARGYSKIVRLIEANLSSTHWPASICDIGCATGGLLKAFSSNWQKFGIEPSNAAASLASAHGVVIIGNDWKSGLQGRQFDCISLLSVIEHVAEQDALLQSIAAAVKPGGLVFIETGDYNSLWARFMGQHWYYYNKPEHVVFHSQKSLGKLLHKHGFVVVVRAGHQNHKSATGLRGRAAAFKRLIHGAILRLHNAKAEPFRALWHDHQWVLARRNMYSN